jgi:hypothetical protein
MLKNAALSSMNSIPYAPMCCCTYVAQFSDGDSNRSDVSFTYDRNIQATEKTTRVLPLGGQIFSVLSIFHFLDFAKISPMNLYTDTHVRMAHLSYMFLTSFLFLNLLCDCFVQRTEKATLFVCLFGTFIN